MPTPDTPGKLPNPAEDPEGALVAAVALRALAERLEAAAVQAAVDQGWSWAQIAQSLGVTRQAAHKKHAKKQTKNQKGKSDKRQGHRS